MNWYKGKKIYCLGDSITYGAGNDGVSWVNYLAELMPETEFVNYGVSGSTISLTDERDDSFVERYSYMKPDGDVIVVFGGINDFNHGVPLGVCQERGKNPFPEEGNTFYGALNTLIRGLLKKYPAGELCMITPMRIDGFKDYPHWNTKNQAGFYLSDYRKAILEVCGFYGVPVLDLFTKSGLTTDVAERKERHLPDGLHPGEEGYKRLTRKIYNFINYQL